MVRPRRLFPGNIYKLGGLIGIEWHQYMVGPKRILPGMSHRLGGLMLGM